MFRGKNILMTGGTGYSGSTLVRNNYGNLTLPQIISFTEMQFIQPFSKELKVSSGISGFLTRLFRETAVFLAFIFQLLFGIC